MKTTANYGLKKPEGTDVVNIDDFNENADIIDTQIKSLNDKKIDYGTASGTNTYTVTIPGATLTEGRSYKIKFTNANTGASTLNINGLGAKSIVKSNGNALSSGNIKAGQILHLVYTGSVFQLLGEGGEYGTAQPQHVLEGYTIGTEEGLKTGTMPNRSGKENIPDATWSQPGSIQVRPPKGYYDGVKGTVVKWEDTNFIADNIRTGKNIFGLAGTFTSDATATASQILSGQTAYVKGNKITGTMPNNGAKIITPSTTNQAIPAGYHNGQGYVVGSPNLKAENIKEGVSIFGIIGSLKPVKTYEASYNADNYTKDFYHSFNCGFSPDIIVGEVAIYYDYGDEAYNHFLYQIRCYSEIYELGIFDGILIDSYSDMIRVVDGYGYDADEFVYKSGNSIIINYNNASGDGIKYCSVVAIKFS